MSNEKYASLAMLAEFLATENGKHRYRRNYDMWFESWRGEFLEDNYPAVEAAAAARQNARANALSDCLDLIGVYDDELTNLIVSADGVDARKWIRSTDPDKIYRALASTLFHK